MRVSIVAFISGVIFAIGLGISGMTQPQKIIAFLNINSKWSPALILVMASALLVSSATYFMVRKKMKPFIADHWSLPTNNAIDKALIFGSILFGIGWGLAGYCPGPAFVSLVSLQRPAFLFVASMLFGMFIFKIFKKVSTRKYE